MGGCRRDCKRAAKPRAAHPRVQARGRSRRYSACVPVACARCASLGAQPYVSAATGCAALAPCAPGSPSRGSRPGTMATSTQSPPGATSVSVGGSSASKRASRGAALEGVIAAAALASPSSSPGCSLRKACSKGWVCGTQQDIGMWGASRRADAQLEKNPNAPASHSTSPPAPHSPSPAPAGSDRSSGRSHQSHRHRQQHGPRPVVGAER